MTTMSEQRQSLIVTYRVLLMRRLFYGDTEFAIDFFVLDLPYHSGILVLIDFVLETP